MVIGKTNEEIAQSVFSVILLYIIVKVVLFVLKLVYSFVLPKFGFSCDLKKYGEWAVVTGSTDGIGKEFALQLAEKGFSIVLISRSKNKLEKVAGEIISKYKVLTKTITYDFSKTDGYDMIKDQLKSLDIGILVNNVGAGYEKVIGHDDCDLRKVFDNLNINIFSAVGMTHIVTQRMAQQKRGLVIHISSITAELNWPFFSFYAASKYFLHKFAKCLAFDHDQAIHHQVVIPGYVVTNLSKVKESLFRPMPYDFVKSILGTAGRVSFTHGYWAHDLQSAIVSLVPEFLFQHFVVNKQKKEN